MITQLVADAFLLSVHLARQPKYTLNLEGGSSNGGAKILLWPHEKGGPDLWRMVPFDG